MLFVWLYIAIEIILALSQYFAHNVYNPKINFRSAKQHTVKPCTKINEDSMCHMEIHG